MIAQIPRYVTPSIARQAQSTVSIRAVAVHEPSRQRQLLDVLLPRDGRPCKPRLVAIVQEQCGQGWSLFEWVTTDFEF